MPKIKRKAVPFSEHTAVSVIANLDYKNDRFLPLLGQAAASGMILGKLALLNPLSLESAGREYENSV